MRKRKLVAIGLAVPTAVLVMTVLGIGLWVSHKEKQVERLLTSIPEPPEWMRETNSVTVVKEFRPYGFRDFAVAGDIDEIADFYAVELPKAGWYLLQRGVSSANSGRDGNYILMELEFAYSEQYYLTITLVTSINLHGVQDDRVSVSIVLLS